MRRLCHREWNWQLHWISVNQHSWNPRQRTTWSRRVTSDFNSVLVMYHLATTYAIATATGTGVARHSCQTNYRHRSLKQPEKRDDGVYWNSCILGKCSNEIQKCVFYTILTWIVCFSYNTGCSIIIWRVSSQNGLYPCWSIWDIWDLSCWNIKKIIRKCLIITSNCTFISKKLDIIRKALFCIIMMVSYL